MKLINKLDWSNKNQSKENNISDINQGKPCSKKLSKHVPAFDYIGRILIFLSPTGGGVCIISPVSVVGAPVEIAGVGFTLIPSGTTGIIKKLQSITKSKKKKA